MIKYTICAILKWRYTTYGDESGDCMRKFDYSWDDDLYLSDDDWYDKLYDISDITQKILKKLQNKPGMEKRQGQLTMSYEITESVSMRKNIMIEAGVGIGKSFAYLIPALLIQRRLSQPIVIVTSSIALSNQLMSDVKCASKIISDHIHAPFDVSPTLAKGARNYVCKKKRADLIEKKRVLEDQKDVFLSKQDKKIVNYPNWILDNTHAIEKDDFDQEVTNGQWKQICGDSCSELKRNCPYKDQCYYNKMRNSINNGGNANVIIINMDMFIVHLKLLRKTGKGLLNEDTALYIIDEAHNLEEKTRSVLTISKNIDHILNLLDRVKVALEKKGHGALSSNREKSINAMKNYMERIFNKENELVLKYKEADKQNEEATKFKPLKNQQLKECIDSWNGFLKRIYRDLDVSGVHTDRNDKIIDDLDDFMTLLDAFLPESNNILWFQKDEDTNHKLAMCTAPKNIDDILMKMLFYNDGVPKILTSATLCQNNLANEHSYDYQKNTIGFIGNIGLPQKSPFNYKDNAIMYVPNDIDSPSLNHENYLNGIAERIKSLADITKGRTLCLFTSKKDMDYVYTRLNKLNTKWKVLKQTSTVSQKETMEAFKKSKGILLSTGLWEGFNIKGPDISSVVIVKLPFPVPDPIINYKVSTYGNNLNEVTIPEMLRKLRQGIGRLIRSNTDTGIVSILDSRMKRYQKDVLEVSPIQHVVGTLEDVKLFSEQKGIL